MFLANIFNGIIVFDLLLVALAFSVVLAFFFPFNSFSFLSSIYVVLLYGLLSFYFSLLVLAF